MSAAAAFFPCCRDATGLLTDFLDGNIPWPRRLGLRLHLGLCPPCRRLLASLADMPPLLRRAFAEEAAPAQESARLALDSALTRIGQPRVRRRNPAIGVPEPFAEAIADGSAGLTLRLMAETQAALAESGPLSGPPFLPKEVLAQLPSNGSWRWLRLGTRVATLGRDAQARLFLLQLRSGGHFPKHSHHGRESLLILQGGLEDGGHHLGPGEWTVHAAGSAHAPAADRQGCWALARLEGEIVFSGWLGLLQRLSG